MTKRQPISQSKYLHYYNTSTHFNYFFDKSFICKEGVLNDIKGILEKSYRKYRRFFEMDSYPIIPVYIYPKLIWMHKECYGKKMPNWCIAGGGAGAVVTLDPSLGSKDRSYDRMIKVLAHELAHEFASICSNTNKNSFPEWFNEGLAMYLAKYVQNNDKLSQEENDIIIKDLTNNKLPHIDFLEVGTNSWTFKQNLKFIYTISMIETIIKSYGKDKILNILKNPKRNIFKTLGISKNTFQSLWHKYLKEKYLC